MPRVGEHSMHVRSPKPQSPGLQWNQGPPTRPASLYRETVGELPSAFANNRKRSRQLPRVWTASYCGVKIEIPMTSLVSWVGIDHRKPASIYIASDSRISWDAASVWDSGRKVFASRTRPEIFGYVGDVLFPSLVLGQIADAPASPVEEGLPEDRFEKISQILRRTFHSLPSNQQRHFKIAYGVRTGTEMAAAFRLFSLSWDVSMGWCSCEEPLPSVSDSIVIWGSGAPTVATWKERWDRSSQGSTSRAIFSAFCDAVGSGKDKLSGGAPQLVGLYRIGGARTIGTIHEDNAYLFGLLADTADHGSGSVEWRNRFFERCNVHGDHLATAQTHHVPKGLGATRAAAGAAQPAVAADGASPRR